MSRKLAVVLVSIVLAVSPAFAEGSCDLSKAVELVDSYASQPFSARTWRVLKGLGDPMLDESSLGSRWDSENAFKEIARRAAPNVSVPDYIPYDCRMAYPLEVLQQRATELGEKHPYVEQWVRSQIAIFSACGGDTSITLPPPIQADGVAASLQLQDRKYQQATLVFYQDRGRSLDLFRSIGSSQSPHRAAARYMVANILANARRIGEARAEAKSILGDVSLSPVHGITQELLGYIANLEDTPEGWTELLDSTIAVIETPASEIQKSAKLRADYVRSLKDIDYAGIRGKDDDWWLEGKLPEDATISKAIVDASRRHAIVPWMIAGQTAQSYFDTGGWAQIGPKWQDRVTSLVDRALALTNGTPDLARATIKALQARPTPDVLASLSGDAREAGQKALSSCGEAPETAAAAILTHHAVRVAAMSGNFEEANALLEAYPFKNSLDFKGRTVLSLGRYLLGQGALAEARRYRDRVLTEDFFRQIEDSDSSAVRDSFSRLLMWIAEDRAHWDAALALNSRKTEFGILNFLPVKQLIALSRDEKMFAEAERALFIRAAWTRVYAIGKKPDSELTKELFALNPELKQIAENVQADYPAASDSNRRLLTILRTPRYNMLISGPGEWQPLAMTDLGGAAELDQYDHNDRNWWCPFEPDRHLLALRGEFDADAGNATDDWSADRLKPVLDQSLQAELDQKRERTLKNHPVIRSVSWKELRALTAAPGAPRRLAERAMAWAKKSSGKDGAPEALALAVRATRYGCNWHGGHKAYSKSAQELLWSKFGGTTWAAQTPYWFDCMNQKWSDKPEEFAKVPTCDVKTWPRQKLPN